MKLITIYFATLFLYSMNLHADNAHSQMNHSLHHMSDAGLQEAGNDAFGTIQEVITKLNNNPNTDWSKVNIEALRQHLIDMNEMTLNIDIVEQQDIDNGLSVRVKPTTQRATVALARVFEAHPAQLERETGWKMHVSKKDDVYMLNITTRKAREIEKIRGLGYIGLMAYGNHHQPHHWAMATGKNPHKHH